MRLVLGDPGGFFEDRATILRARAQDHVDSALLHHGVSGSRDPGVSEKALNVAKAALCFVEQIFGVPIAINAACHAHIVPVDSKVFLAIGKRERHLREAYRLACVGAVEDHVRHFVAAKRFGGLFPKRPAYGVEHIGFSATVRAHDRGDPLVEVEEGFIGKRFEAE